MKNVYFVDDKSIDMPTIKMTCDCGWIEKAYADRDALTRAEMHIRVKHTTGKVHYNGLVTVVGGK